MSDKDIEKELKDSADKITVKSFSERWDNIQDRLTFDEAEQTVLAEEPVLVTTENNAVKSADNKKIKLLLTALSFAVCIIITLAIVLPIVLREKEPTYFGESDLVQHAVDKELFFNEISNKGYDIVNLSGYEVGECVLFTFNDEIKGGRLIASEEECILDIYFYDITYQLGNYFFDFGDLHLSYELYTVGSTEIRYNTQFDESVYNTIARVPYKNLNYNIKIFSLTDNHKEIFEKLFS